VFSVLIDEQTARFLSAFLVTLARIAGVLAFTPIPGFKNSPALVRAALALLLTLTLFDPAKISAVSGSAGDLLPALLIESGIGICFGLATALLFEGFQVGAQIIGLQAGFSYASTTDPNSQADSTVLSVLVLLTTGALFFATDLHHIVIRALAEGLARHPAGNATLNSAAIPAVLHLGSDLFKVGLRLAAPLSAIMLTIDIGMALFSRMQPQLQVITLAFSLKILIALAVFSTVIYSMGRLLQSAAGPWSMVLRAFLR